MNKQKRPGGIEWCDYTWSPVTGCRNTCSYCYARKIAERFRGTKAFPDGFEPTFHEDRLMQPTKKWEISKIFVCSMGDLFGPWVPNEWINEVLESADNLGAIHHTYLFLTKYPERLQQFNPWADNWWVGVTVTGGGSYKRALEGLGDVQARVKFISFEPLLERVSIDGFRAPIRSLWQHEVVPVSWVIVGSQTNPTKLPKLSWVAEIIETAQSRNIPVFLKDNLKPLMGEKLRQEWPA